MNPETRISIALSVYNGEGLLSAQLESFVRRSRIPDELILTDNRSSDRTAAAAVS